MDLTVIVPTPGTLEADELKGEVGTGWGRSPHTRHLQSRGHIEAHKDGLFFEVYG